jgi:hypothetical protein
MATIEEAAEAAGMSVDNFVKLSPANRLIFAARVDRAGASHVDVAKRDAIKDASDLVTLERRLTRLNAENPRFASGLAHQDKVRSYIQDRIAGIRRRMDAPA